MRHKHTFISRKILFLPREICTRIADASSKRRENLNFKNFLPITSTLISPKVFKIDRSYDSSTWPTASSILPYCRMARTRKSQRKTKCFRPTIPNRKPHLTTQQRWNMVREYDVLKAKGNGRVRKTEKMALAKKYGVHPRTLDRMRAKVRKAEQEGVQPDLAEKPRPGRPTKMTADKVALLHQHMKAHNYDQTYEDMAAVVGVGKTTMWEYCQQGGWKSVIQRTVPLLTTEHIAMRAQWAEDHRRNRWSCWVDVDEKVFYTKLINRQLKVPPGAMPKSEKIPNKRFIPKTMVISAIAKPRPDKGFDGKVGLWRVAIPKTAQRRSKNHELGEEYQVDTTMTAKLFRMYMLQHIIPAIKLKMGWAKTVHIQFDNASPHTGGNTLEILKSAVTRKNLDFKIEFILQPPRSPDTNANDLGFYRSIQAALHKRRLGSSVFDVEELVDDIYAAWHDYPSESLTRVFETKTEVLREIARCGGTFEYKMPHFR